MRILKSLVLYILFTLASTVVLATAIFLAVFVMLPLELPPLMFRKPRGLMDDMDAAASWIGEALLDPLIKINERIEALRHS